MSAANERSRAAKTTTSSASPARRRRSKTIRDGVDRRQQGQAGDERGEANGEQVEPEYPDRKRVDRGPQEGKVRPVSVEPVEHAGVVRPEGPAGVEQRPR